jgi:hypothetical protein
MTLEKIILHNTPYLQSINKSTIENLKLNSLIELNLHKFNQSGNQKKRILLILKDINNEIIAWASILEFKNGVVYECITDTTFFMNINILVENIELISSKGVGIFSMLNEYILQQRWDKCVFYNNYYSYSKHLINNNWCPIDQLYFIINSFFVYPYPDSIPIKTNDFTNNTFEELAELYPRKTQLNY